jgi:hypothetical protein
MMKSVLFILLVLSVVFFVLFVNVLCLVCPMLQVSQDYSRTAVLTLGVASGQYSCPRLNTTVLGHNTGLISKHPFDNEDIIQD